MDKLGMRAFYISGTCLFWSLYVIYRYLNNKYVLHYWGFKKMFFKESMYALLPFLFVSIFLTIIYGIISNTFVTNINLIPVLLLYPFWGLVQQFIITGLIAQNLQNIEFVHLKKNHIIIITSLLFGLAHAPNFFLMLFSFMMELVFLIVYNKFNNIWALGIVHGWAGTFLLYFAMGRDLWKELFIWF